MSDTITLFQGTDGNTRANMNAKLSQANAEFAKKGVANGYASTDENNKLVQDSKTINGISLASNQIVHIYTCTKDGTVFKLVGDGLVGVIIRFDIGSTGYVAGDTFTVNGVARTANSLDGYSTLPTGFISSWNTVVAYYRGDSVIEFLSGLNASYSSNSIAATTAALRNIVILPTKSTALPTGLADNTLVFRKNVT